VKGAVRTRGGQPAAIDRAHETCTSTAPGSASSRRPFGTTLNDTDGASTRCRRTADATAQLQTAERWLLVHNTDATLLYALGRLCERESLWGKAQTYYEASLALAPHWRTHVALGEMLARLDRHDAANVHLAAALRLSLASHDAGRG